MQNAFDGWTRYKFHIKHVTLLSYNVLTPYQPILMLTPLWQVSDRVATRVPVLKTAVRLSRELNLGLLVLKMDTLTTRACRRFDSIV